MDDAEAACEQEVRNYLISIMPFNDPSLLTEEDGLAAGIRASEVFDTIFATQRQREDHALTTSFRVLDELRAALVSTGRNHV